MVNLHICAVTPNLFIEECFDDFLEPWTEDVLKGFVRVEDGHLTIHHLVETQRYHSGKSLR